MNTLGVILLSLAVWRVSHALVKEKGPRDWFIRFRAYLAQKQQRSGGFFDLFSCVYCISIYIGFLAALWVAQTFFELITYTLSFSALSMLLEVLFYGRAKNPDTFSDIASPAANNKVRVGRSASSK